MEEKIEKKSASEIRLFLIVLIFGLFFGIFIKLFVFDILHVSGSSMSPSLKDGEAVFVNRLAYGIAVPFRGYFFVQWKTPGVGDAVIYLHDNKIVVKRCRATGGTHLDFSSDSDYNLILGEEKIPLKWEQWIYLREFSEVPEGYILAIGDNYAESVDSRNYGFVSVKNITGKIIGK